ncbi:MAG: hypothetical protein WCC21_12855 [Candidatus Acidiferrales bacterium]
MPKLVLRSVCVGIATVALAAFIGGFIALSLLFMNSSASPGGDEAGSRTMWMVHYHLVPIIVIPLVIFAIGFFAGHRYFSKRQGRQGSAG